MEAAAECSQCGHKVLVEDGRLVFHLTARPLPGVTRCPGSGWLVVTHDWYRDQQEARTNG